MVTATTPGRGAGGDWARAPAVSKRTAAAPAISLRIGIEYMGCASKWTRQRFAGEAPAPQGAQWMRGLENSSRARAPAPQRCPVDAGLGECFAGEAARATKVPSGCGA